MSDENQATRPSGQEQNREGEKPRGERRGGGRHDAGRRRFQNQPQTPRHHPESSLNADELREVMELFSAHGLTDLEFENKDIRLRLSRNQPGHAGAPVAPAPPAPTAAPQTVAPSGNVPVAAAPPPTTPPPPATGEAAAGEAKADDKNLFVITSPIVGTFYRAPSPNAEPFVRAGSKVESDTVVCIIEAMKLMNEILAETSGVVETIYVENSQPVEYGQPLFGIRK